MKQSSLIVQRDSELNESNIINIFSMLKQSFQMDMTELLSKCELSVR